MPHVFASGIHESQKRTRNAAQGYSGTILYYCLLATKVVNDIVRVDNF